MFIPIYRNKVVEVDGVKNLEGEVALCVKDMGLLESAIKQLFDVKGNGNLSSSKKVGGNDSYVLWETDTVALGTKPVLPPKFWETRKGKIEKTAMYLRL